MTRETLRQLAVAVLALGVIASALWLSRAAALQPPCWPESVGNVLYGDWSLPRGVRGEPTLCDEESMR